MDRKALVPRPFALGAALLLIAGAIVAIEAPPSAVPPPPEVIPAHLLKYPAAAGFGGATGWLQSGPLRIEELRGQVVLVDFWTYSCINCIRTFPHLVGWWEAYRDRGLVVVGVHTPEFRFERDAANVQEAAERHNLTWPIAQDNDYSIWRAYHNRYWPAKYVVDAYGRIRHTHFGEGAYAETEAMVRALLAEAGHEVPRDPVETNALLGAYVDRSPELYAGATQGSARVGIGNPEGYDPGATITYARPASVPRDRIFLVGTWDNGEQSVLAARDGAGVLLRFRAGGANFVASGAQGACVPVLLDGQPITAAHAARDVRLEGEGRPCIPLDAPRSYDFYAGVPGEHLLELTVPQGFELFSFAFSPDGRK